MCCDCMLCILYGGLGKDFSLTLTMINPVDDGNWERCGSGVLNPIASINTIEHD